MDQIRIGKFIAQCRKEKKLTQAQLAEKLCITDRAVSKWETGKAMPDSAIMLELCQLLDISVNDLLNGQRVCAEEYNKVMEEKLLEALDGKEQSDKMLMRLRYLFVAISILIPATFMLMWSDMVPWMYDAVYYFWMITCIFFAIIYVRISRTAGYYQCENCGYTYIPNAKEYFWATGWTTKRMRCKCRSCGQKNYHKKILRKE